MTRKEKKAIEGQLAAMRRHPAYDFGYSNGWADCFAETRRRVLAGELIFDEQMDVADFIALPTLGSA